MQMRKLAVVLAASLALSACASVSDNTKATGTGAVAGAIGAGVLANLLGADEAWTWIAAAAGAAAGAMVAKNDQTGECYYANGDGTYSKGACQ